MEIANEFNNFFPKLGIKQPNLFKKLIINPILFYQKKYNIPSLNFDEIGPFLVCDILKSLVSKKSCDMAGISTELL